jgi:hypothetical protein
MKNSLEVDENTIVIGHSSGACAAIRSVIDHSIQMNPSCLLSLLNSPVLGGGGGTGTYPLQ